MVLYILLALCIAGVDQALKYLASVFLKGASPVVIIPGFFRLRYTENSGAAFSILQGKTRFLVLFTLAAAAVLVLLAKSGIIKGRIGYLAITFALGGGLGNFIDRLLRGYVIDYMDWYWINFPVFNLADLFITAGAILFIISVFKDWRIERASGGGKQ